MAGRIDSFVISLKDARRPGEVRDGESLIAAASRVAGVGRTEVVAVDLEASPPHLRVTEGGDGVLLRPMEKGDLETMTRWRNLPSVARWWSDDPDDLAGITAHYGPDLGTGGTARLWIAEFSGRSVGFVQDYRMSDHPEYAVLTGHPDAVGVDYLVGEPAFAGQGFGTRMLWQWMQLAVAVMPEVPQFFAAPDHRNHASCRLLRKVGFTEGMWFDEPMVAGGSITVVGHTLDVAAVVGP